MAYSYVRYSGNGSTTNYTFSFPTISQDHIKVRVNGSLVTNWSFLSSSTIQFATAPANAAVIEIRRETPKDSSIVNFTDGSVLLERDLDLLATWQLYVAQETEDDLEDTIRTDSQGRFDANNKRIINVADPVNAQDAVTKTWAETAMSSQLAQATSQATAAAGSATAAAGSANAAATSAGNASTSESNAASSASSASNSATAADGSATAAANSATAAGTSATNANTSAVAAAASATASAGSATTATTQASNAAASAVSAANSAAAAATALDNFDDRYLGQKASDPSVDNDGNSLITGALYYNTTDSAMRVYTGTGWINASSAQVATMKTHVYVATAAQTTFSGNDANGSSLTYVAPYLIVSLNGLELRPVVDYTATSGLSVVLTAAATAGDELQIQAFSGFNVANIQSDNVSYLQGGAGATVRAVGDKLKEFISIKDFGASPSASAATNSTAIQAAVTYAVANDLAVLIPDGEYQISTAINITGGVAIIGNGQSVSRILAFNCNVFNVSAGVSFVTISGITLANANRYTTTPNTNTAINVLGTTVSQCYWHSYRDVFIDGFEVGFFAGGVCSSRWHNVTTVYTHQSVNFSAQCLNNSISQCGFGEQFDSAAGSYGIKVGDGLINCEGLMISDSIIYGVRRGIWVNASINVYAHHNIIDMVREFGVLAQSTASAGCINNQFSSNYIGITGTAGDSGIYLANGYAPTDSQNRGTIIRDNEILAYPGSTVNYGILIDGSQEKRNLISGNRTQLCTVRDCSITAGSDHSVSDNVWRSAGGFNTTVRVSYINNTGPCGSAYPNSIGLFTPTAIGTSTAGAGTYSTQIGSYKIVDKMVFFNIRLVWSAHTGTGDLRIAGLPVAAKNISGYAPPVTINVENLTFPAGATAIFGLVNTGATTIELRGAGNGQSPVPVAMDTAANLNISGFYEID